MEAVLVEKCRLEVWCQQFSLQTPLAAIKWPSPSGREDTDVREAPDGADVTFNKKFHFIFSIQILLTCCKHSKTSWKQIKCSGEITAVT